jgi:hypothetical protein
MVAVEHQGTETPSLHLNSSTGYSPRNVAAASFPTLKLLTSESVHTVSAIPEKTTLGLVLALDYGENDKNVSSVAGDLDVNGKILSS